MRRGRTQHEIPFEYEREEGDLLVTYYMDIAFSCSPFIPAQTYGPPELCYPAEGGEIEDVKFSVHTVTQQGPDDDQPQEFNRCHWPVETPWPHDAVIDALYEADSKFRDLFDEACGKAAEDYEPDEPDSYD